MIYTPLAAAFFVLSSLSTFLVTISIYPYRKQATRSLRKIVDQLYPAKVIALLAVFLKHFYRPVLDLVSLGKVHELISSSKSQSPCSTSSIPLLDFCCEVDPGEVDDETEISKVSSHASCVQWLFFWFFLYLCLWSAWRSMFYIWLWDALASAKVSDVENSLTAADLDCLGHHAFYRMSRRHEYWPIIMHIMSIATLCGNVVLLYPLTYELSRLAMNRMDRGSKRERRRIRIYCIIMHSIVFAFLAIQSALLYSNEEFNRPAHICHIFVYLIQLIGWAYMIVTLLYLKYMGRHYEIVQGILELSPVYFRLKLMLFVYSFFICVFEVSAIATWWMEPGQHIMRFIGFALVSFSLTGVVMAILMGCNQSCIFSLLRTLANMASSSNTSSPLVQHLAKKEIPSQIHNSTVPENPVFVYTDIESSSKLWSIGTGDIMQEAIQIHDEIMRDSLVRYRGYEIATRGDAFAIAFHTIQEAVNYCFEVQINLLSAKWPRRLHNLIPSTKKEQSSSGHLLFSGLRVRMGMHVADPSEGVLIRDVHPITGRTIYTGASEIIVNEVTDLAIGGQILATHHVARWVSANRTKLNSPSTSQFLGYYPLDWDTNGGSMDYIELFSLQPQVLRKRHELFRQCHDKR